MANREKLENGYIDRFGNEKSYNTDLKHGEITTSILDFVENMGTATYTDMNKYYIFLQTGRNTLEEYDPVEDRGGSFPHHFQQLRTTRKRMFDGKTRWLVPATKSVKDFGRTGKPIMRTIYVGYKVEEHMETPYKVINGIKHKL